MDVLEETALFIRRDTVEELHMLTLEGLAMIVCPGPDLREVSLEAAALKLEKEREEHINKQMAPPVRLQREVRLVELAA